MNAYDEPFDDACAECHRQCDGDGFPNTTYYKAEQEWLCNHCAQWEREPIGELK